MTTQRTDAVHEALNAVRGISDDYQTSDAHHPNHVLIPLAKFEQLQAAEQSLAATKAPDALCEVIIAAITKADANFGYSYRLTKMDDTGEEHTLFMDGFEPAVFADREDGYPIIEQRRNAARAAAILSTFAAEAIRPNEKIARFVDKMENAVQADRDLVADILDEIGGYFMDSCQIRGGNGDHKGLVQIAIRYRLSAQSPAIDLKCAASPDHADILETIKNAAPDWEAKGYPTALAEVRDMANVGRASEVREGPTPRAALHADIRAIVDQALDKIETGA